MDKYTVNKRYFGHETFRSGQEELIDAILTGKDCLGIMPTGGGKSLCYQIPALMLPGITVVISPLISLMKDQVMALQRAGIAAAYLNSSMDQEMYQAVCDGVRNGEYQLLYVAPERLENDAFVQLICRQQITLVAVDEAHCISHWGQDFRPSYLKITDFIARLEKRPTVAAFTATATAEVREDIIRLLRLENPKILVTGFDRPNLFFEVRRPVDKMSTLLSLVRERQEKSGIIYCATRAKVEQICEKLNREGISATRYHAGLSVEERRGNQEEYQFDRKSVMVATNAFGMGIDKSNVGYVIHYNMPKSLEAYYQEAGRAGRDGESADCILLYSAGDVTTAKFLIENGSDNELLSEEERHAVRERDYRRLEVMVNYCKTVDCLRAFILTYFGQVYFENCKNCGNCNSEFEGQDITVQAQKILSCVKRVEDHLGYCVGAALITRILYGSRDRRIGELDLHQLSTYGIMGTENRAKIREYIDHLIRLRYLHADSKYGTLRLASKSAEILYHGKKLVVPMKMTLEKPFEEKTKTGSVPPETEDLFLVLKKLRSKIAQREGVPAYIVFSNATLQDMARRCPQSRSEFLDVSGVGEVKNERYGKEFLREIRSYFRERK